MREIYGTIDRKNKGINGTVPYNELSYFKKHKYQTKSFKYDIQRQAQYKARAVLCDNRADTHAAEHPERAYRRILQALFHRGKVSVYQAYKRAFRAAFQPYVAERGPHKAYQARKKRTDL